MLGYNLKNVLQHHAFVVFFAENTSNYAVAALTIERTIAVCVPLLAMNLLGRRFTIILLVSLTLPAFCFYLVASPITSIINRAPQDSKMKGSCRWDKSHILGFIWAVVDLVYGISLHSIIDLLGVLIIIFKLKQSQEKREELCNQGKVSRKENQATKVMLLIAISNLIIYGTYMMIRLSIVILEMYFGIYSDITWLMKQISIIVTLLTIIPHSLNLLIFLACIPQFRKAAFCYRLDSSKSLTKSHATT